MPKGEKKLIKHYKKLGVHFPSKDVYPVHHKFDMDTVHVLESKRTFTLQQIRDIFSEVVGEYEHGTADVEDLHPKNPMTVAQYAEALRDAILCLEEWQ